MNNHIITVAAVTALLAGGLQPAVAATSAYSTTNLNIRSGPSVRFPSVGVLGTGAGLTIHGCLARYTWCDVEVTGLRGWVSGAYLQILREERRVYVPAYPKNAAIPVVTFHLGTYWQDHYSDSVFYGERDRWEEYRWEEDGVPPGWRGVWIDYDED